MKRTLLFSFLLLMTGGLSGCAQLGTAVHKSETVDQSALPPQLMYQVLLVELLAQRGEHNAAYKLLKPLVEETRDPQLAHRLFQLSMQTYRLEAIETASRLWHEIEPDNPTPLRALWLLKLRQGDIQTALSIFDQYQAVTPEPLPQDLQLAAERVVGAIETKHALAFAQALRDHYDTWAADWAAGLILLGKARPAEALKAFEAALARGGDAAVIYPQMARAYLALNQAQAGLERLRDYVRQHPDNWQLQAEYARLEVEVGDFAAAQKRFEQVLRKRPDADVARLALGLLQFEQGDLTAAKAQFEQLLDNPVTAQVAAYYLAQVYEKLGQLDKAVAYYAQVRSPKYRLDAQLRVVHIVYRLKGLDAALKLLERLSAQNPREQAQLLLARATLYAQAGQQTMALKVARKILENPQADRDTLMQLANLLYELKADTLYERTLRRVLALAPEDADALNALGYFYVERNRHLDEAEKLLFKAIRLKPNAFYIEDSIGWLYWRKGVLDKAAEWLHRALDRQADAEVLAHLLQVEAARGRWAAVRMLRQRYDKLFKQHDTLQAIWRKISREMGQAAQPAAASK